MNRSRFPMRLLYVIDSLAPGGAETSLAEMTPHLVSDGIDLHVLPLKRPLDLAERLRSAGARVHSPPVHEHRAAFFMHIMKTARAVRPDLIHTTLYDADVIGRSVAAAMRLPASTSWVNQSYASPNEGVRLSRQRAAQALDRATCRFADHFHAVSATVASDLQATMGVEAARIRVIPRGREPARLPFRSAQARTRVRHELGLSAHAPLVLAVGRQEPQKALHLAVEAVSRLSTRIPDISLALAGREGRATPEVLAAIEKAGIQVSMLGHRTDVADLMAAADVLAFPSQREGSPGTLIEAMAVGLPIVSADIGPCREVLGGDATIGRLVPPNDVTQLASAIGQALTDHADSAHRRHLGRLRFLERYTIEAISQRMSEFFSGAAHLRERDDVE